MTFRAASIRFLIFGLWLLISSLVATSLTTDNDGHIVLVSAHEAYEAKDQQVLRNPLPLRTFPPPPSSQLSSKPVIPHGLSIHPTTFSALDELRYALSTMQEQYFSLWLGKWTSAIDWTAAVMSTYVTATLSSLSRSVDCALPTRDESGGCDVEVQMVEDEINKYFAQTTAAYYGEEAFSIRYQAYDDILWVVLEWLESIKFIELHTTTHHALDGKKQARWHAQQFISTFAHRARVFYELAEKGWDWHLCDGGLTWNPRLLPYKNAITNQLFISASISMYLDFPGDENCSPVLSAQDNIQAMHHKRQAACDDNQGSTRARYDPIFRQSAINGYDWLKNVGMINNQGLYTDGFHIRDYRTNKSATTCDERNEMVYTYNQGVILSGMRGLWEATGDMRYLEDGHDLVQNVIRATGYRQKHEVGVQDELEGDKWYGLGSKGILSELCDPSGTCNQDGQTFKGIFFHHLTAFCETLPRVPVDPGSTYEASEQEALLHHHKCESYTAWVFLNAQAALRTRDHEGRFGSWWGAPDKSSPTSRSRLPLNAATSDGAFDYRNYPTLLPSLDIDPVTSTDDAPNTEVPIQVNQAHQRIRRISSDDGDLNDRGRGRTVETQGSGLAVVRAMYEFRKLSETEVSVPR